MSKRTTVFNMKLLRLRMGWTHSEMAAKLDCSVGQLRAWEASRIVPRHVYQQYLYNLETIADGNMRRTREIPLVDEMVIEHGLAQICYRHSQVDKLSEGLTEAEFADRMPGPAQVLRLVTDNSKTEAVGESSGTSLGGTMSKNVNAHQNESLRGDPIIAAVLDELVALTGWDPIAIWPSHNFHSDLEMSEGDLGEFLRRLGHRFMAEVSLDFADWKTLTLRDVVARIRESQGHKAAA